MTDYDHALSAARRWLEAQDQPVAPVARLEATLRHHHAAWLHVRLAILGIAACIVTAWICSIAGHPVTSTVCAWVTPTAIVRYGSVHVGGVVLGAGLSFVRRPGAQLLARATWVSALLSASAGMVLEPGTLPVLMPVMAIGAAGCLWLLSAEDPVPVGSSFDLAAHRGLMTAVLILAMADIETLAMAVLNHEEPGELPYAIADGVCVLAMAIAVWGLYHLRTWGLMLNLGLNLVIASLGMGGLLFYEPGFAYLLMATAAAQLLLCTPLLRSMLLGPRDSSAHRGRGRRLRHGFRALLVLLLLFDAVVTIRSVDPDTAAAACDR